MDRLLELAETLTSARDLPFQLELEGSRLQATLESGRQQAVRLARHDDDYVFRSTVVGRRDVPRAPRRRAPFLLRIWERNAAVELVAFGIDNRGRLVGHCRHPVATLDLEELRQYVIALVRECDRLEWVLVGRDRY